MWSFVLNKVLGCVFLFFITFHFHISDEALAVGAADTSRGQHGEEQLMERKVSVCVHKMVL